MTTGVIVEQRDPHDALCMALLSELSAELSALYDDEDSGALIPPGVPGPRGAFVVAWLDGVPVGCGAIRPARAPNTAEVKRMYVRPAARGKGISRQILQKLETLAVGFGYTTIILETGVGQPAAIGLYENDPLSVCYQKSLSLA
jgi:hypothetical protein